MKNSDIKYLKSINDNKIKKIAKNLEKELKKKKKKKAYENELTKLQLELLRLQDWVSENDKRVLIIFEGRDAAGKGGTIKRFIEHLNPRKFRIVALPKPTKEEMGQFYFQRYFKQLPNPGEIVFFDRSWYNRAIVEPVFNFCTPKQYQDFIKIVPKVEEALIDDGMIIIKIWLDIDKDTQKERFDERKNNPLKQWKLSPIDLKAQEYWDKITFYQEEMFNKTATMKSPWVCIDSNSQKKARVEAIKYVLSKINYDNKSAIDIKVDSKLVKVYNGKKETI